MADVLISELVDPPDPTRGPLAKGISTGVAGIKSAGYGLKALGARIVGAPNVEAQALADAQQVEEAASADNMDYRDVNSVGSAVDWAKFALGSALPSIAVSLAGGVAGRAAGAVLGRSVVEQGAKTMLKDAGFLTGAGAGSFGLETGGIFPEAVKEGVGSPVARSAAGGAAAALLDVVTPAMLLNKVTSQVARKAGAGAILKGAAVGGLEAAGTEGVTETAQTFIERLAAGQNLTNDEAIHEYITAGLTGAIAGGGIGGPVSGVSTALRPVETTPQPANVQASPVAETPVIPEIPSYQAPTGGPVNPAIDAMGDPAVAAVQALETQHGEITAQLATLDEQLAAPGLKKRDRILLERQAAPLRERLTPLTEEIARQSQRLRNVEALRETPTGPISPRTPQAQRQEAVVPKQQVDTTVAAQAIQDQLLDAKIGKGELLTSAEATRQRQRTAQPAVTVPVQEQSGGTPRSQTRDMPVRERQQAVVEAGQQSATEQQTANPKLFKQSARADISGSVSQVLQAASQQPTLEATKQYISDNLPPLLKGKMRVTDAKDFALNLAEDIGKSEIVPLYSKGAQSDAVKRKAVQAALNAANVEGKRAAEFDVEEELKSIANSGGGPDISELARNPEFWDAENEVLTDAGSAEYDRLARKLAEERAGHKAATDISNLDSAGQTTQAEAFHAYASALGLSAKKAYSTGGSRYVEVTIGDTTHKIRFANHFNTVRDTTTQPDFNVAPGRNTFSEALDWLDGMALTQPSNAAVLEDDGTGQARPTQESYDQYQLLQTQAGQKIIAHLQQLIGVDPNLEVKLFLAEPGSPIGSYTTTQPYKDVIQLALNAKDEMSVADHEGFHYLVNRKLTAQERSSITRALRPDGPLFKQITALTRTYDAANNTNITDEVLTKPAEAQTYAFEFWRRGALQVNGTLAKVFAKVQELLERIRNLINGLGFQSIDDIFHAIDRGEMAQRAASYDSSSGVLNSTGASAVQTESAPFKAWFGGSKVVDAEGKPLVVYHGTRGDFAVFDAAFSGSRTDGGYLGAGFYASSSTKTASYYGDEGSVYPVFMALKNPLEISSLKRAGREVDREDRVLELAGLKETASPMDIQQALVAKGFDGVIYTDPFGSKEYVAFKSEQIKSATGNRGTFDPNNPNILFSKGATLNPLEQQALADEKRQFEAGELPDEQRRDIVARQLDGLPSSFKGLFKAVLGGASGGFKRVRDLIASQQRVALDSPGHRNVLQVKAAQNQRKESLIAEALEVMMSEWNTDATTDNDIDTVGDALWARDKAGFPPSGTIRDPAYQSKLAQQQKAAYDRLNPKQIKMFNQAGNMIADRLRQEFATDQSRYITYLAADVANASIADKAAVLKAVSIEAAQDEEAALNTLTPAQATLFKDAADYRKWFGDRSTQVQNMIAGGWMPHRRHGNFIVYVFLPTPGNKKADHLSLFSQHFETEAGALEAHKRYSDALKATNPELRVEVRSKYQAERESDISFMKFVDTAARYGIQLTYEERAKLVKGLIQADSIQRNKLLKRENIPGESRDTKRVLAEFGVLYANKQAYTEFSPYVQDSLFGHPVAVENNQGQHTLTTNRARNLWAEDPLKGGYYRGLAEQMVDNVDTPQPGSEWAQRIASYGVIHMLGASFATAASNLTSLPLLTAPWLSQHTDYTNAMGKLGSAFTLTLKNQAVLRDIATLRDRSIAIPDIDSIPGLRDGLVQASSDSTTLDTELRQITGATRGDLLSRSRKVQKALDLWMLPFRFSEQVNRTAAFIAAFNVGREGVGPKKEKLTGRALYEFAQETVKRTQFDYSTVNRPTALHNPTLRLLFMFKTFPLYTIEMLETMWKAGHKGAVVTMLTGLAVAAGVEGLPFAEDVLDLIDVVSQRLFGSPFNLRRAMRNQVKAASEALIGLDASELFMRGTINAMTGLNVASRIGSGDILPGTRLGTADTDYGRLTQNILGVPGALAQSALGAAAAGVKGTGAALTGDFGASKDAFLSILRDQGPVAIRNLYKGVEQFSQGFAQDSQGRKVADVSGWEAAWQSLGFSSANVSKMYELDRIDQQSKAFYTQVRADFTHSLVKAMRDGNTERAQELMNTVTRWNAQYPEMPISFEPSVMRRNIALAGMPLNARTLLLLPKQLRGTSVALEGSIGN